MGRSTSSTFVRYRMGKDHFDRFFGCLLRLEALASWRHSVTLAGPVPLGPQRHRVDHPDAKVLPVACRILAGPGLGPGTGRTIGRPSAGIFGASLAPTADLLGGAKAAHAYVGLPIELADVRARGGAAHRGVSLSAVRASMVTCTISS